MLSLQIPEELLQFEGQTKGKLGTPEARTMLKVLLVNSCSSFRRKQEIATNILEKWLK